MITITCGKCKKEIKPHLTKPESLPSYMITKVSGYNPVEALNLCPDCEKKFDAWLKDEEM